MPVATLNKRVPLWTVEADGQLFQGVIRVPTNLCNTPEHSNERLKFMALIRENLDRWIMWRAKRGWFIGERPRVSGPFDPPESDRKQAKAFHARAEEVIGTSREGRAITEHDYAGEVKWYVAEARFTRHDPVYARLEDMLELRHLALKYEVDPDRDPLPYTDLPEGEDVIEVQGGEDPMVVAEERRQRLGLNRSDYLMGKIEDPL